MKTKPMNMVPAAVSSNPEPPEPIGGPTPIDPDRAHEILKRIGIAVVAGVWGLVVIPVLVAPGRCAGATRSSKVRWQERQEEVTRAINAADATPDPSQGGSNQATQPTAPEP